ncbi:MAG: hypothetical protein LJF15_00240, partial [Acidobacteria bacterium]|nr:hypothetical protein [Acidobacteriota bacterium]
MATDDRDATVGRSGSETDMDAWDIRSKRLDTGAGTPSGSLCGPRRRAVSCVAALSLLAGLVFTISSWLVPGVVGHASAAGAPRAQKVVLFDDVTISLGETRETVVVVGGRVDILGTVENLIVVVGGDVFIGPEAQVGMDKDPDETAVVVVFGDVTVAPGAQVGGERVDVGGWLSGWLGAMAISPDYEMWSAGSIGGWAWLAVFFG